MAVRAGGGRLGAPGLALAWLLVALGLPAGLRGQDAWSPGVGAGLLLRLEQGADGIGIDVRATLGRAQTPQVEVEGAVGFWSFPDRETVLRRPTGVPGGSAYVQSEELSGPYVSLAAARRVPAGGVEVLLRAAVAVGLLRERMRTTGPSPPTPGLRDFEDREITPTWTVGAGLRARHWELLGFRPRADARIGVVTLAGDDFIPVAVLGIGATRSGG